MRKPYIPVRTIYGVSLEIRLFIYASKAIPSKGTTTILLPWESLHMDDALVQHHFTKP